MLAPATMSETRPSDSEPREGGGGLLRGLTSILGKLTFSLLLTVALAECGAAVLIYSNRLPARPPSYAIPSPKEPFFIDIDPRFGAWHPPNKSHSARRACYATVYRSNSYGAIDDERVRAADEPRVIVLGDSFATGHGVIKGDRFSDRLETLTGIPHLNFGAGGTGPTQYAMVYEHLARDFAHDAVLVSVLPANDFFDDEPTENRYRPYWSGEPGSYTLRYTLDQPSDSSHHPSRASTALTVHDVLGSFSFFYNAADYVAGYRKVVSSRKAKADFSGYFDFSDAQLARLRHSLAYIKARSAETAARRPGNRDSNRRPVAMTVMLIPRFLDLIRYQQEGRNPLGARLTATATTVGFQLVDMLPTMARDFAGRERELFLGCDGHWSPLGHEVAAERLYEVGYEPSP